MREIKFRVWNKPLGQYINKDYNKKYYIDFKGNLHNGDIFNFTQPIPMESYIIEQYTGLKDKNGVEIYENDLLQDTYYHIPLPVKWIDNGFWVVRDNGDVSMPTEEFREVVGNIHTK